MTRPTGVRNAAGDRLFPDEVIDAMLPDQMRILNDPKNLAAIREVVQDVLKDLSRGPAALITPGDVVPLPRN